MQQPARAQEYEGYWGNVSLREGGGAGGESPQALMSEMKKLEVGRGPKRALEAWDPALGDSALQSKQLASPHLPMGISAPTARALRAQTSLSLKHSQKAPPTPTPTLCAF